jgi:hypothetical protein
VFAPDREWEKVGQVPNVVFVEGMVRDGERWLFYYGGADKNIGERHQCSEGAFTSHGARLVRPISTPTTVLDFLSALNTRKVL